MLERVAAIRECCGKYFGIAIDFHSRVHKLMTKLLAKKAPMFIEEPVICEPAVQPPDDKKGNIP